MFLIDCLVVILYPIGDCVASQQPVEGAGGAIHLHVAVFPQNSVGETHMVAVIVGQHDSLHAAHVDGVAFQFGGNFIQLHSGVDQKSGSVVADIGAVARASGAERNEFQSVDARKVLQRRECVVAVEEGFPLFCGASGFLLDGGMHGKVVGLGKERPVEVVEEPGDAGLHVRAFLVACHEQDSVGCDIGESWISVS